MSLDVSQLTFTYGTKPLIRGFDLNVVVGAPTLLKGDSGSGKTTFMKLCAGLLTPQSGSVSLDGVALGSGVEEQRAWRRERCAYLDQESSLVTGWSVYENLSLVTRDRSAQDALLNKFDLHEKGPALVSQLSGGERQRVAIARLLLRKSRLALVDEPTAHLDDRHTRQVLTEMARHFRDSVLIVVSHDRRVEEFVAKVISWRGVQK